MFDAVQKDGTVDKVMSGTQNEELSRRVQEFASICTAETDMKLMGEEE
jgi:hypothetical protein